METTKRNEGTEMTETHHVIDRRDGERVAGGFTSYGEAEAWMEKTDRRGSDEFEVRESTDDFAGSTDQMTKIHLDAARDRFMGDWDQDGTASVHLPRDIAESLLAQAGWSYVGHGCWTTPDTDRMIDTDSALQLALTAQAIGGQA